MENEPLSPMLYLVATPIGNMEDITLRAISVLRRADAIYCEDTRHSGAMLAKLQIKKPLFSCHEHNENARAQEIAARVKSGEAVAYISDAGMPGISDPGSRLIGECIAGNVAYTVIPGPSAMPTALVLSGIEAANACFVGFLPRVRGDRRRALEKLSAHEGALIFYESPLRLAATAAELAEILGDRECVLCRELTKLHEETVRATLSAMAAMYDKTPPKGECVLVVAGAVQEAPDEADVTNAAKALVGSGMSAKDAAKALAQQTGLSKNDAYNLIKELTLK